MTIDGGRSAREPIWLTAAHLPACFGELSYPPAGLWYLGDPESIEGAPERHVAIVGTRECSAYGERTAARMASACAKAGLVVVSGLARGIDAAAHRAALEAGGKTIAVMGTGADVPYPAGHRSLHEAITRSGAVVSEMEPGMKAFPGCFPRRNRLIAALSKVTLVVEAGFKSGAMNTARHAEDLNREIAAVPGQIDDPRSAGTNALIRDHAHPIIDVEELLALFGLSTSKGARDAQSLSKVDAMDAALLALVGPREQDLELIAFQAGLSGRHVADRLTRLELEGLVVRGSAGYRLVGS